MPPCLHPLVAACLVLGPLPAVAAVPVVVTDIPPVQSLVAAVMAGVAQPEVLLPPGASPHDVALRPSEAQAIARADVMVWIGEALSPGLARAVATAPEEARRVELLAVPGTRLLPYREIGQAAEEAAHDHDHDHDPAQDHDHDHSGTEDQHNEAEGHAEDGEHHHHSGTDPHAWLDPANARLWLAPIAAALSEADPEHAATYAANAAAADTAIAAAASAAAATLEPVKDRRAIVIHDAFGYWETAFGMPRTMAISASDAARPGPAHLAELKARIAAEGITCLMREPQSDPRLATLVAEGAAVRTGDWDPLGSALPAGPDLYPALLKTLATAYADCAAP